MTMEWSDEEQDDASHTPSAESTPDERPTDDVVTAPVVVTPAPPKRTGPFRIYSPHDPDLTDEMRTEIEIRMTAGYWLHKALQDEDRVELPDEFRERRVLLKLVLQEVLVLIGILLMGWLLSSGWLNGWSNLVVVGIMLVGIVVGFYLYKLWSITYIVSTASKTGISRERIRWMFINEIEPELTTKDIILSRPWRNKLFSTFNVNWWRVYLDTAAEDESPNLKTLRFVRDGDRLVQTIDQFKLALR